VISSERLMNGPDQRGELIGPDLMVPKIRGDNLRGEFGRLRIGHRSVPLLPSQ